MRHYALLLGILLTSGSAFLLHLAVDSDGFERLTAATAGTTGPAGPASLDVWYGGELPPIRIDAGRGAPPGVVAWVRMLEGSKREASSTRASQPKPATAMRAVHRPASGVAL
jgi:hypothetical protein